MKKVIIYVLSIIMLLTIFIPSAFGDDSYDDDKYDDDKYEDEYNSEDYITVVPAITAPSATGGAIVTIPPAEKTSSLSLNSIKLNGLTLALDIAPYIKNSRTLVPIRIISENIGATVLWDGVNNTVTIIKDASTVILNINDSIAIVDGSSVAMDQAAEITNGRTFVPIRFVSETLGLDVVWDSVNRMVELSNIPATTVPASTAPMTTTPTTAVDTITGSTPKP